MAGAGVELNTSMIRLAELEQRAAALDSTGLETTSASAHYKSRSGMACKKFIKVSVCVLAGSLLPSGLAISWGPGNDKAEARDVLAKASVAQQPKRLFADAGDDAEWVHRYCRVEWQVVSIIKPAVHRSDGGLNGDYRSQMTEKYFEEERLRPTLAGRIAHERSEAHDRSAALGTQRPQPVPRSRPQGPGLRPAALAVTSNKTPFQLSN